MDVFAAVGLGVAVEQVSQSVEQSPCPGAVDHLVQSLAVGQQQAQQVGQLRRGPVTRDVALGEPDVARLERSGKRFPVVQVHAGMWSLPIAHGLNAAIGQMQGQ